MHPFLIFLQFQNKDTAGVQYNNLRVIYSSGYLATTQDELVAQQPSSINLDTSRYGWCDIFRIKISLTGNKE